MNILKFDSAIIGGGCAGLSLALSLAKKEPDRSILILESRNQYISDRTWCFWNVNRHPFEAQVQYRWNQWQVCYNNEKLSFSSKKYAYHCIPSEHFYQEAIQQIHQMPHVTLFMNTQVHHLKESTTQVMIDTTQGIFTCSKAYDSRLHLTKAPLYQHFHGWQIVTEHPVFNPHEVILMDFNVEQVAGLHFMYLLPFSPYSALIESTYISPLILQQTVYEKAIKNYLEDRYGLDVYKIMRTETGILPLQSLFQNISSRRIIPIGINAGWMRASTGYAFLRIQEEIKRLIDSKEKRKRKRVENYLDKVFLSYVQEYPLRAPELFFNLFKKNSPETIIRFLTSSWSYKDLLKVILSMPTLPMLKQALQCI